MSEVFTSTSVLTNLCQTAYDRLLEFALRSEPLFRNVADKKPAQQTAPGASIVLSLYSDLAAVTSPLSESTDTDVVAISNPSQVTVTLQEYGNAAIVTRFLEATALSDVDPAVANIIAYNCANSVDGLAQTALATIATTHILGTSAGAGSTTITANPTKTDLTATNLISSAAVRYAVAKLRANNVVPTRGQLYTCYIHPEVSHDLRAETGSGGWRESHITGAPDVIWPGEIGQYEGAAFIENSRCLNDTGGNSSARIFNTYFLGQQALAEATAVEPHIVIGPVIDRLARFRPIGWHAILGWSLYRTAASYKLWTSSSIHAT